MNLTKFFCLGFVFCHFSLIFKLLWCWNETLPVSLFLNLPPGSSIRFYYVLLVTIRIWMKPGIEVLSITVISIIDLTVNFLHWSSSSALTVHLQLLQLLVELVHYKLISQLFFFFFSLNQNYMGLDSNCWYFLGEVLKGVQKELACQFIKLFLILLWNSLPRIKYTSCSSCQESIYLQILVYKDSE